MAFKNWFLSLWIWPIAQTFTTKHGMYASGLDNFVRTWIIRFILLTSDKIFLPNLSVDSLSNFTKNKSKENLHRKSVFFIEILSIEIISVKCLSDFGGEVECLRHCKLRCKVS
jgi:hypothetical protein